MNDGERSEGGRAEMSNRSPEPGGHPGRYASEMHTLEALKAYICSYAAVYDKCGNHTVKVNWQVCEDCVSQCAYGRKYAQIMRAKANNQRDVEREMWVRTALAPLLGKKEEPVVVTQAQGEL